LRDSLAQAVKEVDVFRTTKVFGVLETEDDADLSRFLNALDRKSVV